MKFLIKHQKSTSFNTILIVLNSIALISFLLNITIVDFINIITSINFWYLIPKSFILLLPLLEFIFISFLAENDLNKKIYKKMYPYTFLLLLIIGLILKFLFDISIYNTIIIEWWINTNCYQAILLSIILCLSIGFIQINISYKSINFYYYIDNNGFGYSIGGLIIVNKKTGGRLVVGGAPSISSYNKTLEEE